VNLGRPINEDVAMRLRMDPDVTKVEPFRWVDADWRGPRDTGGVSVFVSGIDTSPDAMMFSKALDPALRARLNEPGAVIVDKADLDSLGVNIGDTAAINGQRVRVVGVGSGLRALGGVNIVSSLDTARVLDVAPEDAGMMTYFVAKLRDPSKARMVAKRLSDSTAFGPYTVWTAKEFARQSQLYWMLDTGAGAGVLFLAGIVFLVGAVITSQTLIAAVIGSIREYATLNALGVGRGALRKVIMEQAFWVGALGIVCSIVIGMVLLIIARNRSVPMELNPLTAAACLAISMALAIVSGLAAMRSLRSADPASLLR
jgi:putative ABC transport system permease protein